MSRRLLLAVMGVLALAAAGVIGYGMFGGQQAPLHGSEIDGAPRVPPLELVSASGHAMTLPTAFQGDITLVFFGYAHCPDVCPLTMAQLASTHRDLGEPDNLQVVMVTVDPENDTPQTVDAFAKRFHPDFIGLGGDADSIAYAAETFFVGHHDHESGDVIHSGHVTLLDPDGRMRRVYTQDQVPHLCDDLEQLLVKTRW